MNFKVVGATLIIFGCGCFGFLIASSHKKEVRYLRNLLSAISFLLCEMQYHLTPLPDLCRQVGENCDNGLRKVFTVLACELENQISPNVKQCMTASLSKIKDLPVRTRSVLLQLGNVLGHFDIEGQTEGLKNIQSDIRRILEEYTKNQDVRLRSYQTLGVCAGAAIVILFI